MENSPDDGYWKLNSTPFLFSPPRQKNDGNFLGLKVANSKWSKAINIDTVGWEEMVLLELEENKQSFLFELITSIEPGILKIFFDIEFFF